MTSSCTYYAPKCGLTRLCDQNCGVQPADRQTHSRHTDFFIFNFFRKVLENKIAKIEKGPVLQPFKI